MPVQAKIQNFLPGHYRGLSGIIPECLGVDLLFELFQVCDYALKRGSSPKEHLAQCPGSRSESASQVFVFGSAVKGQLRPDSDIDMAVSGLPANIYFSAISQASDLIGRPVDLVDLDDDSGLVRYLRGSGELIRVG
jgi:predicted nucleotidyltransferase